MKQLDLTPQIKEYIANAVGPDVDPTMLVVFEAIATNNLPLPGKGGTIFQSAVIAPMTLTQMAESINGGNSLPLIFSHDMSGVPVGRAFYANVINNDIGVTELRVLFYVDSTEQDLITKLNAGSLDEVSVAFLPTQLTCSSCGFDYMGPDSTSDNLMDRTCDMGHEIGTDGVYANLVGLSRFIELSLVTRGAADGAKIVGKSASKIQPSYNAMKLAAKGFDTEALICRASQGENQVMTIDTNKLIADLMASGGKVAVLEARAEGHNNALVVLQAQADSNAAAVVSLTAERDALITQLAEANTAVALKADYDAGIAFLQETARRVLVAAQVTVPAEMPATAAELSELITKHTTALSAVLPIGGKASGSKDMVDTKLDNLGAFKMAPGK